MQSYVQMKKEIHLICNIKLSFCNICKKSGGKNKLELSWGEI